MLDCVVKTVRSEGITALWKGLEPALWRQASYGGLRYGLYAPIKDALAPGVPKAELPLHTKIVAGGLAGAVAQGFANPCDLVKVRMMADGMGTSAARPPQYRWFLPTVVAIGRADGLSGLYKGLSANMGRAVALAAAEMASYDSIKPWMASTFALSDGLPLHGATAVCSGFIAALAANPFDVVKSRVMNSNGQYTGMRDCFIQTVQGEGVLALWKGFIPAWARVGPRVIIAFVTMEQLRLRFG